MIGKMLALGISCGTAVLLLGQNPAPELAETPLFFAFRGGAGTQSFLGVAVAEVDGARAHTLKLNEVHGVEITRLDADTAASKAGLKMGDVVLEYNGQRVEGTEQFIRMVRETPPGREVKLLIARNGATQVVPVTMGSRKAGVLMGHGEGSGTNSWFDMGDMPMPEIPRVFTAWSDSMLGIEVESLTPQLSGYFGVNAGVLVRSVAKNSSGEKAGIKAGDVVVKIDQSAVTSPSELRSALRAARPKHSFVIEVMREKRPLSVTVTMEDDHSGAPHTLGARPVKM